MTVYSPPPAIAFPPNPVVGQTFMQWVWNGSMWICQGSGPVIKIQQFAASGTYFPSPGLTYCQVELMGGGGGGGGAVAQYTGTGTGWLCGGGGGASGQYSRSQLASALVLGGVAVTIGVGGAAGGPSTSGGMGGTTTFGVLVSALGGNGGDANNYVGAGTPMNLIGRGGPRNSGAAIGDFTTWGNAGWSGLSSDFNAGVTGSTVYGGVGGAGYFGGAAQPPLTINGQSVGGAPNGTVPAGVLGCGGDGGASGLSTLPAYGAAGGNGVCLITEFCFGNTNIVQDCGCGPAVTEVPPGYQQFCPTGWGVGR